VLVWRRWCRHFFCGEGGVGCRGRVVMTATAVGAVVVTGTAARRGGGCAGWRDDDRIGGGALGASWAQGK